jgi:hypothetical protein
MSKIRPSGHGAIVNWDTGYCYLCKRQFKGRIGLWSHVTKSPFHNKQKKAEIQRKQLESEQANLETNLDTGQKTLDDFLL